MFKSMSDLDAYQSYAYQILHGTFRGYAWRLTSINYLDESQSRKKLYHCALTGASIELWSNGPFTYIFNLNISKPKEEVSDILQRGR